MFLDIILFKSFGLRLGQKICWVHALNDVRKVKTHTLRIGYVLLRMPEGAAFNESKNEHWFGFSERRSEPRVRFDFSPY